MEHQGVAVGVVEEGHVADAGIEDISLELDPFRLELRSGFRHGVHPERQMRQLLGLENPKAILPGSQLAKQVCSTQNSKRAFGSGFRPSVST